MWTDFKLQWRILALTLLTMGGIIALFLFQDYRKNELREMEQLATQAQVVEKNVLPQLLLINRVLEGISKDLPAWQRQANGTDYINHQLQVITDAMIGVRTILIFRADGTIVGSNVASLMGKNFVDREYFQTALKSTGSKMLHVSAPFKNALGVYSISLFRTLTGPDGKFAGIVIATVIPEHYSTLVSSVSYAPDVRASLIHGDGKVFVSSHGKVDGADLNKPGSYFLRHMQTGQSANNFTGVATATKDVRMMGWRTIQTTEPPMDKPLVIAVSRNEDDSFSVWRKDAYVQLSAFAAICLISVLALYAYLRQQRKIIDAKLDNERQLTELVEQRTAELAVATRVAESANRTKGEFLANMSHEIRTPLNAVLGLAQVGQRESVGHSTRRLFDQMLDSGRLLLGVINDILDFSKIEAGKLSLDVEPISRKRLVDHLFILVGARAADKGVNLRLEEGAGLPTWFEGDFLRLAQVFGNLLSNAVKFTERGEVVLSITQDDGVAIFTVRDTGIGMSGEQMSRLFNPFEQADNSNTRKFGGTGLGLTIAKQLVALMSGTITVSSRLGAGSTFEVRLPYKEVAAPTDSDSSAALNTPMTQPDGTQSEGTQRLSGYRILAAEDNPVNQLVLEDMLVMEGATLVCADDGLQALDVLQREGEASFDIVLTDIQMPHMDGHQLAQKLRQLYPMLPVAGLTAHAMAQERQRCFDSGMVAHVTKPIDLAELVQVVRQFARKSA